MQYFTSIFWPSYSVLIKSVPSELDVPEKHTVYHIKKKPTFKTTISIQRCITHMQSVSHNKSGEY